MSPPVFVPGQSHDTALLRSRWRRICECHSQVLRGRQGQQEPESLLTRDGRRGRFLCALRGECWFGARLGEYAAIDRAEELSMEQFDATFEVRLGDDQAEGEAAVGAGDGFF
jgi:hypothetical protein